MTHDPRLKFRIAAPEGKTIPLHDLAIVLNALDQSLASSYRATMKVRKVTAGMRDIVDIGIVSVEEGSIILNLAEIVKEVTTNEVVQAAVGIAAPVATDHAANIFSTFKNSLEFYMAYFKEKQQGQTPRINVQNNSNTIVIVNNGGTINVGDITLKAAAESQSHFQRMAEPIQNGKLSQIECLDAVNPVNNPVQLTAENSRAFETELTLREANVELTGVVLSFDRPKSSGRVMIMGEQDLPEGIYPFKIQDPVRERLVPAIDSLKGTPVSLTGFAQYVRKAVGAEDVVFKIYVTDLAPAPAAT